MPRPGIDCLLETPPSVVAHARVGLVTHAASLCGDGRHAAAVMAAHPGIDLRVLFAPEHGFAAAAIDWTQYHRNFFLALKSQKRIMFVILVLIVVILSVFC